MKAYNLTELISEQAEKQLSILAYALQDEQITIYRLNRDMELTQKYVWGRGILDEYPQDTIERVSDIIHGPGAESLAVAVRHAIDANETVNWEENVDFVGGGRARFRDRIVPYDMPDGSREALVKAYNLTELVTEQADKQLTLLAEALKDEPIVIYRMNRDLVYTAKILWGGGEDQGYPAEVVESLYDIVEGEGADIMAERVRHAIDTGEVTSFESPLHVKNGNTVTYRARLVPVTMPDGSREVLVKGYNLTELVSQQGDKQLSILADALKDEPIILHRFDENLNYTWAQNWPKELEDTIGPLTNFNLKTLVASPEAEELEKEIRHTFATGEPTQWAGKVNLLGNWLEIRARFTRVSMPDGSYQVFGKSYNLTELVSREAEKQLDLLATALQDEPIIFSRINEKFFYTWTYSAQKENKEDIGSGVEITGHNVREVVQGPTGDALIAVIQEAFDTWKPTTYEGYVDIVGAGMIKFRARYVPIIMPDGSRELFIKAYNLSELVSQEGDKQLALLLELLQDEPISLSRIYENLDYTFLFNGKGQEVFQSGNRIDGRLDASHGQGSSQIVAAVQEAFATGKSTSFEGMVVIPGQAQARFRARYVPVAAPDGSRQVYAKIYNLTELVNQEAEKQMELLANALTDEPLTLYRIDRDLHFTWVYNWPKSLAMYLPVEGKHLFDVLVGLNADTVAAAILEAIETNAATSFLGKVDFVGGITLYYRGRFLPVTHADGSREVFAKVYNLTELGDQEAERQTGEPGREPERRADRAGARRRKAALEVGF